MACSVRRCSRPIPRRIRNIAQMFYQAQKEVYGDVSHFYATDPFHEGGNTGGIGRDIVGRAVLDEMKAYDSDAIWVTLR